MSTFCDATLSHCPRLGHPIHHVSDASTNTHVRVWNFSRKCGHFFGDVHTNVCISFLCSNSVVEHRSHYDPIFKWFWIPPVQIRLNMHLDVNSVSTRVFRAKIHCTPQGFQVQFFVKSVFAPYFIQFCCPFGGWIWIRDSDEPCSV